MTEAPESCMGCRFVEFKIGDDEVPYMQCRRYPGQIVVLPDGELLQVQPSVRSDDWCGEFQPK